MLKRETIIDRRPTTTTRSVNVNWFQNRHTIAEQHRQVYRIIVDDRSGRKGGHRTNTTTSNDNDYWPSPTTAASLYGLCLSPWTTTSSLHKTMHNQEHTKTHTGKVQSRDQILEPKVNNAQAEQQLAQILH
ncbi:hypothetical protein T03_10010 [Trichinella britovi]|uniref:Uncharacterized protein n=1 Tax=Trichinella britovi TaxID=45882 RepID=A0A0V1CPL2_TRIBR|nr:hypothetical protein T03_10010 [Trichinella britovi]